MIVFDKNLATDKHLWVFNNNIIKFHDDTVDSVPVYADIITVDFTARLYPDPLGKFTFNFKEYLKAIAVKNYLADMITFDVDDTIASLVYDDTENVHFPLDVEIIVQPGVGEQVSSEVSYDFICGVEQLEDYQRGESPQLPIFMLQKPIAHSRHQYRLNYWPGYPFDISIYSSTTGDLNILNVGTGIDMDVPIDSLISRIAFADAQTNETIEDHLPLGFGENRLRITRPGYVPAADETPLEVVVNKHSDSCGVYVKFRSESGGWSYWMFNKNHGRSRSVSDLEELENDFNNIEDTFAPTMHSGKASSSDVIRAIASGLTKDDIRVLEYIVDSPKLYMFTGQPYSINSTNTDNQWIEIKCATKTLDIVQPKKNKYNVRLDFALPERNRVTLL